ncbi:hypothetical protein ALC56_00771 [Trachymyrmex septentrionalis]|uniref:Elongation of very long chain fatty acids protein n=2 Tax=Trachymyrmex TaxID=34717 RepID=A0A195FWH1_9HYME|nr:hypothetical protein ALC56_00771 [Trachymyrmex septentrionalis]
MVDTWPLMESPGPMLCIVGAYLLFVLKVGPKMMEKRPAFELNAVMIGYNAFQVLFSIWLTTLISRGAWWYFFAKIIELLDTVFFVLRKKQNQITFLHVFHHSTTACFSWCYLKFLPGEQGIVIGFLNSVVHIIMYSYYLIAALGPKYRKYIWWKKYMTWIQLVQFGLMLVYLILTLIMDYRTPKALTYFFTTIIIIFIYLFNDFYRIGGFGDDVTRSRSGEVHSADLFLISVEQIINISSTLLFHPLFFSAGIIQNVLVKMIIDVSSNCHNYIMNTEIMSDRVLQIVKTMALDQYTEILTTVSDPRVSDWPLMDSPVPTILIVLLYLYGVVIFGPRMMANRKPYKLRGILVAYNAFQVVFSLGMMYEHLMSGWLLDYSYKCQPVDYSHNPSALRMANLCWWYFISKFTEFADTIFFVLRKKDSQVTFLHLYHHSLTPLETWICVKFIAGGHGTLGNLINNAVHVVMYAYYMLAAMGPEFQKYLWWKKHLTTVQLVQFFLVFVHSAQALIFDCGYPKLIAALLLLHATIFFVLFSDFYRSAYRKGKSAKELKAE